MTRTWRAVLAGSAAVAVAVLGVAAPGATADPERLNGPLTGGGQVIDVQIAPSADRVVYRADQDTDGVAELYSRPIDGSGAPAKLNGPLPVGGDVSTFAISPDGTQVVYRADQDTDQMFELYSRPIDGSGAPAKLNGPLVANGDVGSTFAISPDGSRVVYHADQDTDQVFELYSRPIGGGGTPAKLNGPLVANGDVVTFTISPDSSRVVYLADQDADTVLELYSRPIGGGGTPAKLNGPLVANGDVDEFAISPDGTRVVYLADQDTDTDFELYSRPIGGGGTPSKLNGPLVAGGDVQSGFLIAPDSSRVVYHADQDTNGVFELYSRPIDGSATPTTLNGPLVTGGDVTASDISADGSRVVYIADQETDDVFELYSRPIDGGGVPIKLNGPLVAGGDVSVPGMGGQVFAISPDGSRVAYTADQDSDDVFELYSRPIDGGGVPIKLNGPMAAGGDVRASGISPDGSRMVYLADQDTDETVELYSARLTGGGLAAKLNGPLPAGGDVAHFDISADSAWTVYLADQFVDGVVEVLSVATTPEPGYWLLEADGDLMPFGEVPALASVGPDLAPGATAVALAAHPDGQGVWVLTSTGDIVARGSATDFGAVDLTLLTKPAEQVATMSATPDGDGLWVFTTAGRIIDFGTALPGDQMTGSNTILALDLDGPIIDSVATPTGLGAYLVASDGGVFAVGDATFIDSVRGALTKLNGPPGLPHQPVVGITPDPDGHGYWNVGADGGVFSFEAPFRGSLPALIAFENLVAPINGMVPFGNGYLLVAADGGVFTFSNLPFQGSASGQIDSPVVDIATIS